MPAQFMSYARIKMLYMRGAIHALDEHLHLQVQLGESFMMVKNGEIVQSENSATMPGAFPFVQCARPICVLNSAGESFTLSGHLISGSQDMVHCRMQGNDIAYFAVLIRVHKKRN